MSKKGLKYGDEDEHEAERAELAAQQKAFAPLLKWLNNQFKGTVGDGMSGASSMSRMKLSSLNRSRAHEPTGIVTLRDCRW